MEQHSPVIAEMKVIPAAGYDSMLMTLSGAHAPWFTRNLVLLTDSAGRLGVGEIHGGDHACRALEAAAPDAADTGEGIQGLDLSRLKFVGTFDPKKPALVR